MSDNTAIKFKTLFKKRQKRTLSGGELDPGWNTVMNIIVGSFALICVLPFILTIVVSFTDELALARNGYVFFPEKWSLYAYNYVFKTANQLGQSYIISLIITVFGTLAGLIITVLYAYPLSRKEFKYRKILTFIAFFTMLFNGGLIPFYIVCSRILFLRNTIWALIFPLLLNPFFIIIMRTFFQSTIPDSIIESARIDGASELTTFIRIVFPISLPGMATIGLFIALGYWNDWFHALLFITESTLYPLQYLLMQLESQIQFIMQNTNLINSAEGAEILKSLPIESTRMTMVVLATIPIAMAYPFFQRYFVKGLTIGSVKG